MNIVVLDAKTLGEDLDISSLESFGTLTVYQTTSREETLERIQIDLIRVAIGNMQNELDIQGLGTDNTVI